MKASFNGSDKIVEELIAAGVSLNLRNKVSLFEYATLRERTKLVKQL